MFSGKHLKTVMSQLIFKDKAFNLNVHIHLAFYSNKKLKKFVFIFSFNITKTNVYF